ncbi:MAG: hypothetical protein PHW96_04175, partial [Candidatus Nanoarchaeia archaeon]|nr:hypothetical protein [Candidatus Nanoarchaeia archaeon]
SYDFKWRVALTIYGSISALIFVIAFLSFYPTNFTVWQNIAVVLISPLVLGAAVSVIWIPWKMKNWDNPEEWERFGKKMEKKFGEKKKSGKTKK